MTIRSGVRVGDVGRNCGDSLGYTPPRAVKGQLMVGDDWQVCR